ncbi:MAG: DNA topoisomerase 4 subunit A [Eubacteriales bacterium]|nr:DNA topoisomerase 4 subunit A [Eubacteriales bacterium]MDD3882795.1 DNA topoisomerase 4 subunit A [Eubacteriales bacterium]MDD4512935.1 DNA topoisomerase 4 subunit A [Eubacteriales bacterium]
MPKKPTPVPVKPHDEIITADLGDVMHMSMLPYAEHVILERALPSVEDGLKPVQRRILFTMQELGLAPDKPHRKSARIVGDCLGKYHPHGDSSVYDAMVRLAQPYSMSETLVDGHGNFGSIDGDSAAAMRYTEARMTPLAMQMLRDLDKDTVPFHLNFDDTLKEPDLLPARFPNLLVNGASGIAVGLATNIPPHNFSESIHAVMAQIENPDITLDELMKYIPAPDFPTGGVLIDTPDIRLGYETGRAKITLRSKVHIEDGPAGRKLLVITEVPYQVPKAAMLEKILKLSEERKNILGGIYDIRDESDRTGLRAVIELKRDTDAQKVLNYLYKYSDLQVTFGVNMVAIADGKPIQMGLKTMIAYFIKHQENVIRRRTAYELDQAKARRHILEGLMIAVDNLDEVIKLIRASKSVKEAKEGLMKTFALSDIQAQAILDLRLQRLTGLEILALRKEYAEVLKLIDKLEGILKSEKKLLKLISDELAEILESYGSQKRRTEIIKETAAKIELPEEIREPEDAVLLVNRAGQFKRLAPKTYDKLREQEPEGDDAEPLFISRTKDDATLYLITNLGFCYPLSASQLPEVSRAKERGVTLAGLVKELEANETVVAYLSVRPGELQNMNDLLFFTKNGLVKRSAAPDYDLRRQKRFTALSLKKGDELAAVRTVELDRDVLIISRKGFAIRFESGLVPVMGRTAAGVKGMSLDAGDEVMSVIMLSNGGSVLLMTDKGYAKRLMPLDFEAQNRGGKGARVFPINKNAVNGNELAAAVYIEAACTLVVTQAHGTKTPIGSDEVALCSRSDKGRPCVMALMDDVVTGIAIK